MRISSVEMVSGGEEGAWWTETKEFGAVTGQPDKVTLKSECFNVVVREDTDGIEVEVYGLNDLLWSGIYLNDDEMNCGDLE